MNHALNYIIALLISLILTPSLGTAKTWQGYDIFNKKNITIGKSQIPTVLLFLSAKCPCSNSHLEHFKELHKEFGGKFNFVAINSNADESPADYEPYFKQAQLPFPVVRDTKATIADDLGAFKTPHAFVVNHAGKVLYRGAASNSRMVGGANQFYLKSVLLDIQNNRKPKIKQTKALGCHIRRSS